MAKTVGFVSLTIFALSVAVQIATFIPAMSEWVQYSWPLHLATMAVFGIMVITLVAQQLRHPKKPAEGIFANWREMNRQNKEFQSKILAQVPRLLRLAFTAAFIYVFINFGLFLVLTEGGSPAFDNGRYYLHNHGREIRELSEEEYDRFQAYVVRGFSGHWMLFSLVPSIYFLVVHPRLDKSFAPKLEKKNEQV